MKGTIVSNTLPINLKAGEEISKVPV